jgi:N-acetylglucosaminyldiphosphoundecaprenol N-acetyl-beta-D-mannosaminyltransferase
MERLTLLGVQVDILDISQLNASLAAAIEHDMSLIVGGHNLHSVYLYHRNARLRGFYHNADLIHIDGMWLIYWGRLLDYRLDRSQRVTYVDWLPSLMQTALNKGWRIFYLGGGQPGVAERAATTLRRQFSGLELRTHHGYFGDDESVTILNAIEAFHPSLVMVGMGMLRQEHWILDHLGQIIVNAILAVGACFDYVAGAVATPPRWMGQACMEWLYRLVHEPRRLWKRNLFEPWMLMPLMVRDFPRVMRKSQS